MTMQIRRAAVLGAGVMGAQIAAHMAAAGVRVYLLDLPATPEESLQIAKNIKHPLLLQKLKAAPKTARVIAALQTLLQLKPAPFMTESHLDLIIPGQFDDDFSVLASCDWIIEAVVERIDIKRSIHKRIAEYAQASVPVTTNTSGISLEEIAKEQDESYQKRFFGTHFFNPPRYMHLVEIIPHEETDKKLIQELTAWIEQHLGKGIVWAKDTVNFVANRLGVFAMQSAMKHAADLNLNFETIDMLSGPLLGRSKSATFRTMDVVGLDTYAAVTKNTYDKATDDPFRSYFELPAWLKHLIETKRLGQKSNSTGCYKKSKDSKGKTEILSYRPEKDDYESQQVATFAWLQQAQTIRHIPERIAFILEQKDDGAEFIWRVTSDICSYSSLLLNDIAYGKPKTVDDAIKWGFNWEMGPFELWQAIGYEVILKRLRVDKQKLPSWCQEGLKFYTPDPLSDEWLKNQGPAAQLNANIAESRSLKEATSKKDAMNLMQPVVVPAHVYRLPTKAGATNLNTIFKNDSASLVDLGDNIAGLVFHSKMNAIDEQIIESIQHAVLHVSKSMAGLVIANNGEHFSAGANLKMILQYISKKQWSEVDRVIREFQGAMQLVKFAPFPSVTCSHGLTLGGGCEVALQTSHRLVYAETYAGLVEIGVGLLPAGGGTKELALRSYDHVKGVDRADPMVFLQDMFMTIAMAKTSTSGHEAIQMRLFDKRSSFVSMSKAHMVNQAKQLIQQQINIGYQPNLPQMDIKAVGDPGIQTIKMMLFNMQQGQQITEHEALIGEHIATVLCGGSVDGGTVVSEQYLLELERKAFVTLCQTEKTQQRIEHMLKTGKPLRN